MIRAFALAVATVLAVSPGHAHSHKHKALEIVHPWCLETNDAAKRVAVFMTIKNVGVKPDKLLRASASTASKTELRAGAPPDAEGEVLSAIPVGRGEVNLKRGGPHILLTGMKKPLGAYDSFLMTLTFERAGKVEIEVMVEESR